MREKFTSKIESNKIYYDLQVMLFCDFTVIFFVFTLYMNIIAIIGVSIILFYVFNEFLKHNNLEPMDFCVVYVVYILFIGLTIFLPNKVTNLVSFK